jgi:CBS-domain-containing membrane protein
MNSAIERLLTLRVRDVMNPNVVQIRSSHTMAEAAALLAEHCISGAPVVDEQGRCVGILSAADYVHRECQQGTRRESCLGGQEHILVQEAPESPMSIDAVSESLVRQHMTAAVQAVDLDRPILDAARRMCAAHVHRLPVLDDGGRAVGVVSSLDIVAAMVKSIEE